MQYFGLFFRYLPSLGLVLLQGLLLGLQGLPIRSTSTFVPCLDFLPVGLYSWAGVIGLIWCLFLSPSLAFPTFFKSNNKVGFIYCMPVPVLASDKIYFILIDDAYITLHPTGVIIPE